MDIKNKICLITGANSGIGKQTAMAMARKGAYVVMVCRNKEKAAHARREIINKTGNQKLKVFIADLAPQNDIHQAAAEIFNTFDTLDILINNAGIIPGKRRVTSERIERTLAINHLGPFLLTRIIHE